MDIASVGHVESGFDGKNGWSIDPLAGPTLLTGRALSEMAEDAWFDSALHSADHVKELTTVARTQFDKRPAYQVKVVYVSGVQQTEYFDAETGFQIGSETERETPMGVLPTTTMLREYQEVRHADAGDRAGAANDGHRPGVSHRVVTNTNTVPANAFDPPPHDQGAH